jgi:hypothetical protein
MQRVPQSQSFKYNKRNFNKTSAKQPFDLASLKNTTFATSILLTDISQILNT